MQLQLKISEDGIIEDAQGIRNVDIASELELPPQKIHCSVLAEDAIKAAIADYRKKRNSE
jgi:nitrogen fixation NifU-like protein